MQNKIESSFLWILLLFAVLSLLFPEFFISCKALIPMGLGLIMFGIGINTSYSSFKEVLIRPTSILILILFRFIAMPFWAFLIAQTLHLNQTATIGLLILGTAPGGTAANVMSYLSKSNVSLTVLLTFGSTLFSPFLTPLLIYLFLHKTVALNLGAMMMHISIIILIPIGGGLIFSYFKSPLITKIKVYAPIFSILLIAAILASLLAMNQQRIFEFPLMLIIAVLVLNLLGYITGNFIAYLTNYDSLSRLAVSFDYGMFDAIVAMVICTTFFDKETAIPAVLISIIQNLTAPCLVRWRRVDKFKIENLA
ncbi:MAG: bile acid:sodium symporter family protein [Proteobacteria bacterium]|nr:bile acid:sodium symporter family protein [Pseudomonadota bacterium]